MEFVLIVVVVVVVLMFIGALGGSSSRSGASGRSSGSAARSSNPKQRVLEANDAWLRERWAAAEADQTAGNTQRFPAWYFDEATDRQRNRLTEDGIRLTSGASKGQHSDVIGLFVEPEPEELEMLKFFGIVLKGPLRNQTRARHEIAIVQADPEKQRAWLTRPADALQREFYRFIGAKPPAGLTFEQAEAKMGDAQATLTEAQRDEWSMLENLVEEFEDRELRSDLEIRKPSPADIRAAMQALKSEGMEADDPYTIAEKLLVIKPALKRSGAV